MPVPLYQAKAEFFRTLGHPARIRVLELLSERDHAVHELLARDRDRAQQPLASSSRCCAAPGSCVQRREGGAVVYSVSVPEVRDLLLAGARDPAPASSTTATDAQARAASGRPGPRMSARGRDGRAHRGPSDGRRCSPAAPSSGTMRRDPRRDLIAGVTVAVVALPLALAFGITSGLGAAAGLVDRGRRGRRRRRSSAAATCRSVGPTGAMTVVLVPIVAQFGAGAVLVVGLHGRRAPARARRTPAPAATCRYIPLPVVEGFTLGIAFIIALQQVPAALGVPGRGREGRAAARRRRCAPGSPTRSGRAPVVAAGVVGRDAARARGVRPAWPVSLPAVVVAVAVATWREPVGTDHRHHPRRAAGARAARRCRGRRCSALLLPAVAVAALAALESLLSATVADGMSVGERHDPDRELFGQGLANLAVPLFGGIPATAAIARTAVNVRSRRAVAARGGHARRSCCWSWCSSLAPAGRADPARRAGRRPASRPRSRWCEVSSLRALLRATRGDAVGARA